MTDMTGRTTQSHEWYQELLGAYALGALPAVERAALEAHLASCPTCQDEVVLLRIGAGAYALMAEERAPSPELRERVWQSIWAEPNFDRTGIAVVQPAQPPQPVAQPTPIPIADARAVRESRRAPIWPKIAAALAVVMIGSLLAWNVSLRSTESDLEASVVALEDGGTTVALQNQATVVALQDEVTAVAAQGEVTTVGQLASQSDGVPAGGEVEYLSDRQVLLISLHDLPPLPEGEVYQLWLVVGDQINPSIPFAANPNPGQPTQISITADPALIDALAITREPGPIGSVSATSDIILLGEI